MSEWQPIEDFPDWMKDGRFVLVANSRWVAQARYDVDHDQWWELNNDWTDVWGGPINPTHWMPLPAPPARLEGEEA